MPFVETIRIHTYVEGEALRKWIISILLHPTITISSRFYYKVLSISLLFERLKKRLIKVKTVEVDSTFEIRYNSSILACVKIWKKRKDKRDISYPLEPPPWKVENFAGF